MKYNEKKMFRLFNLLLLLIFCFHCLIAVGQSENVRKKIHKPIVNEEDRIKSIFQSTIIDAVKQKKVFFYKKIENNWNE
jgi:hypothetical protein